MKANTSEQMKKTTNDQIILAFILMCLAFGVAASALGFGVGLIFLAVSQAFGVGFVCFGGGALYCMTFGARAVMRAFVESIEEVESKAAKDINHG